MSTVATIFNGWYCHCCIAKNEHTLTKCHVCGRPITYAATTHLPLHDLNSTFLRVNQVTSVVDDTTIHDTTNVKWTALHFSSAIGNCSLVNELANQGSVINAESEHGNYNTHLLLFSGFLYLYFHIPIATGHTPLHLAASVGSIQTVKTLLQKGANINALTFFEKESPLHICVR